MKYLILGACAAALAGWIVLMAIIFRDEPKKTPTPSVTPAPTASPTVTPAQDAKIWVVSKDYFTYGNEERKEYRACRYDGLGRCVEIVSNGLSTRYQYDEEAHTVLELSPDTVLYEGEVRRTEKLYDANGTMRKLEDYRKKSENEYYLYEVNEYSEKGLLLNMTIYDTDGRVHASHICEYDANGYTILEKYLSPELAAYGQWEQFRRGELDEEGRVRKVFDIENGEETLNMVIDYAADGARTETRYIETTTYVQEFDSDGRLTGYRWCTDGGDAYEYVTIKSYATDDGRTEESLYYNAEGKLINTLVEKYNKQDEIVLYKRIADDVETVFTELTYNEKGQLVKEFSYNTVNTYEYDENGNCIRITQTADGDSGYKFVHDFEYAELTIPGTAVGERDKYYDPVDITFDTN